jgi:C4-type zinc ribbon protein
MARTTKTTLNRRFNAEAKSESNVLLTRTTVKCVNDSQADRATIRAGHCSGCNVRIPSGQLQRVLTGKTIQCEHCRRVLYVELARGGS